MVDLGCWLDGTYRISEPAAPEDLVQGETEEDSPEYLENRSDSQ